MVMKNLKHDCLCVITDWKILNKKKYVDEVDDKNSDPFIIESTVIYYVLADDVSCNSASEGTAFHKFLDSK